MNYFFANYIRYYSKDHSDAIVRKIQQNLDPEMRTCQHTLLCIFHDILNNTPCCYWNKDVYSQTYSQLERVVSQKPDIKIDETIMEYFLTAYHTYSQTTDIINDLSVMNESQTIKNRQYRIPTYISIVEGCLANLFHFIALLLDQACEKDYSSISKLSPLCDVMNKNGFALLTSYININIRNAINHGGIFFLNDGTEISFHYNENHLSAISTLKYYELDRLIENVYDAASAVILGICRFMNNHWEAVSIDTLNKSYIAFSMFSMQLSIPSIRIRYINDIADKKQLNIDIVIADSDRTYILQTAIELAILIYAQYSDYEKYYLSFSNERLQTSWVRFTNQEIYDMTNKNRNFTDVSTEAIKRGDVIIFNPSTEEIDLQEVKYFRFPNYKEQDFFVNNIADASLPDRKRLKCHLFIGDVDDKENILNIIYRCIEWLKTLRNIDSPTLHHKNGDMEADSLYINVYRQNLRQDTLDLPVQKAPSGDHDD